MPLYPEDSPRPTSSEAERMFFRALLKELPKDWTAWHAMRLRAGGKWEGEGDFVFAIPGHRSASTIRSTDSCRSEIDPRL